MNLYQDNKYICNDIYKISCDNQAMQKYSERLKFAMNAANINQSKLAMMIGVKHLDWRAFAGKLESDTSLISTVVDPYAVSSGKLTFNQDDTLTAEVSYCFPRVGGYCKYPNGLKITGKKIW